MRHDGGAGSAADDARDGRQPHERAARAGSVSTAPAAGALRARIDAEIRAAGGSIPFRRYMELALYAPGLGYYASGRRIFGTGLPGRGGGDGSDFVTAPELSPHFGATLAVQVAEWLAATGTRTVWEFGAGSGVLARQLIEALDARGAAVETYAIVELSASLRERQRATLGPLASRVAWLDAWPAAIDGVVVGNEVLDAMPVDLLHRTPAGWVERGVASDGGGGYRWCDGSTPTHAPPAVDAMPVGATTERHDVAAAFVASLAERLGRGAAVFVDYGFPEAEYFHPQRAEGTLIAHRGHRVEHDVLADPGEKDLTAHVDFTRIALAGQDAGLDVAGYTSQGRFLLNLGLGDRLAAAPLAERVMARRLVDEHEMGELFKVLAFTKGTERDDWTGFREGDRRRRL